MNGTDNDMKIQIEFESIRDIHVSLKLDKRAKNMVTRDNHAHHPKNGENRKQKTTNLKEREKARSHSVNHRLKPCI